MQLFKDVNRKRNELEQLRILSQANEITYRQKGESHTAERLKKLETRLAKAIHLLNIKDLD